jgi:hypothetical protein
MLNQGGVFIMNAMNTIDEKKQIDYFGRISRDVNQFEVPLQNSFSNSIN